MIDLHNLPLLSYYIKVTIQPSTSEWNVNDFLALSKLIAARIRTILPDFFRGTDSWGNDFKFSKMYKYSSLVFSLPSSVVLEKRRKDKKKKYLRARMVSRGQLCTKSCGKNMS